MMRLGRVTPGLDIVITEGDPSRPDGGSYRVLLFRGYPGRKVRIGRRLLRAAEQRPWGPLLSALALRMCRDELAETLRGCDLDTLETGGVPWGPRLLRTLDGRLPRWSTEDGGGSRAETGLGRTPDPAAKVSIVLPVYNVGRFLHQSLESCLSQTFPNIELIVVDDGSAGDIASALSRYDDRRLRFLRHSTNRGIATALNTGFAAATGDFLTWTSDDNYYDVRAIETMVAYLQAHRIVDFVYADMYIIDERDGAQPMSIRDAKPPVWFRGQESNPVGACFLYRRTVYETLGEYDTGAFLVEDYEYWLRVAKRFRMQRLCRPLYYYRYHPETLTATHTRSEVVARLREVRRQHKVGTW